MASRQHAFGFPVRLPRSAYTQVRFAPVAGYSDTPDLQTNPASITSGMNVWIRQNRLLPRPRLARIGTTVLGDSPTGAFGYFDINGTEYPMLTSKRTVMFLNGADWQALTYVASGTTNYPPAGGANDPWNATSIYLPRLDANIAVMANGVDPLFAWGGPSNGTAFSTLTQAPIAVDVAVLKDHLVAWNIREPSSSSQLVTRVAWDVRGDPEDWSSINEFAGAEDLLDMRGIGTRVFTQGDELLLATDKEIWRGRHVGPPFVFQFTPFARSQGIPYGRAALQTLDGLFWLGDDFMIYRLAPFGYAQIESIGSAIQRTLHDTLLEPSKAFFGYHPDARQLSLYYSVTAGAAPVRAFTLNTATGTWTPQRYTQGLSVGFSSPVATSSSATTWGALVGTYAAQTLTYNQLLGLGGAGAPANEAVVSSTGTPYSFTHSASSDDGQTVTHDATLGALFASMPERRKYLDQARWDVRADSASSLSVAVSADLGATFTEQRLAISAQSATTQLKTNWGLDGVYHMIRLRTDSPHTFEVNGITVRAKIGGEAI